MADLFKEIIPSIMTTKKPVITEDSEYPAYMVNRALSFHFDCVLYANEMNRLPNLPGLMQYQFLLNTVRSYKRPFQKWHKVESSEDLEAIKEYYSYSTEKAKQVMKVLNRSQIDDIKKRIDKGGILHDKIERIDRDSSS